MNEYTERDRWILSEGMWIGAGAFFIALAMTVWVFPEEPISVLWGAVTGVVFMLLGLYSRKQAHAAIKAAEQGFSEDE